MATRFELLKGLIEEKRKYKEGGVSKAKLEDNVNTLVAKESLWNTLYDKAYKACEADGKSTNEDDFPDMLDCVIKTLPKVKNGGGKSKGTRRMGLAGKIYSPVSHLLQATGNSVGIVANTARNIVRKSITAVNSVGKSISGHTNKAISNITRRKGQRKNRTQRKNRKQQRK